jgi:hypothetical protein
VRHRYSSVAWTCTKDLEALSPKDVRIVEGWNDGTPQFMVPSKIAYLPDDKRFGFAVHRDLQSISGLKVLLPMTEENELPAFLPKSEGRDEIEESYRILKQLNKTTVEAVSDFLRFLWIHTITDIERRLTREVAGYVSRVVMLTVPSWWSPQDMERLRKAAELSGILDNASGHETELHLVPEAEAAIYDVYFGLQDHPMFEVGDVLIACGCGKVSSDCSSSQQVANQYWTRHSLMSLLLNYLRLITAIFSSKNVLRRMVREYLVLK